MIRSKPCPPVIIIGMHRSGTSMLNRILETIGLRVGVIKGKNHEVRFFQDLNQWLMHQCGGSWDHPAPTYYLLRDKPTREMVLDYLRLLFHSPIAAHFLGSFGFLRYRSIFNLDVPWGWKDPRNTFTLHIWLDLFPQAKVIHIYRHGVDVAKSLKIRRDETFARGKESYFRHKRLYALRRKRDGFSHSVRCATFEGGFSLWEEYLSEAKKHVGNLDSQSFELQYEEFLADPLKKLQDLASFCNLNPSDTQVKSAVRTVVKNRAYVYRSEPRLKAFAVSVKDRLAVHGY